MIPFGLFYIVPTIVASLIWFVPEVSREHLCVPPQNLSWIDRELTTRFRGSLPAG
jgi:hypothetical protein